MKKILACILVITLLFTGCSLTAPKIEGTQIKLSEIKYKSVANENKSQMQRLILCVCFI